MKLFYPVSYAYNNISLDVLSYQKKVFEFYNLGLHQVVGGFNHGDFLQHTLNNSDFKYIIFFDVDCIPLCANLYEIILNELEKEECIIGIEQTGMPRYHIYAGPACLALSPSLYKKIESPQLNQNFRSDVAEEITWRCEERAIKVKTFKVSSVEQPKWRLGYDRQFGIGTTYSYNEKNVLYHQFEIRNNVTNFLNKCNSILTASV